MERRANCGCTAPQDPGKGLVRRPNGAERIRTRVIRAGEPRPVDAGAGTLNSWERGFLAGAGTALAGALALRLAQWALAPRAPQTP